MEEQQPGGIVMEGIIELPEDVAEKTYRAIGLFIYQFSQTEFILRQFVKSELDLDDRFFAPVIQPLDVALLCNVAKRVFETTMSSENFAKAEKQINRFLAMNTERVRVAHGLWIPYFAGGMVHHFSRATLTTKVFEEQTESLEKHADEVQAIRHEMLELFNALHRTIRWKPAKLRDAPEN